MADYTPAEKAAWEDWARAELAEFHGPVVRGNYVWKNARFGAKRGTVKARAIRDELDAYKGTWSIVRNAVTEEFREFVESRPRFNIGEYAARLRQWEAFGSEEEPEGEALAQLEYLRELKARTGELIYSARQAGHSWAEVTAAIGMSRSQASDLERKHVEALEAAELESGEPF